MIEDTVTGFSLVSGPQATLLLLMLTAEGKKLYVHKTTGVCIPEPRKEETMAQLIRWMSAWDHPRCHRVAQAVRRPSLRRVRHSDGFCLGSFSYRS